MLKVISTVRSRKTASAAQLARLISKYGNRLEAS